MKKQPYIIGITGGSASGKSSFARELKSFFSDEEMTVLNEDNYYLAKDKVPVDDNGWQNYDIPESIDYPLYIEHLRSLTSGKPVQKEEYTFHNPGVLPRIFTYNPAPIIVLEGIFSFHFDEVKDITDLKLYIDADPTIRFDRRIKRDSEERGLDRTDVEYRWKNHIIPIFEKNHSAYKNCADLIILNNTNYQPGLQVITAFLKDMLNHSSAYQS